MRDLERVYETLVIDCPSCTKETELIVDMKAYIRWEKGQLVQNAFPSMNSTQREVLVSGLCPTCQNEFFR